MYNIYSKMLSFRQTKNDGLVFNLVETSKSYNPKKVESLSKDMKNKEVDEMLITNIEDINNIPLKKMTSNNSDPNLNFTFTFENTHEVDFGEEFDNILHNNPLALFSECYADCCGLNRLHKNFKFIRLYFEHLIMSIVEEENLIETVGDRPLIYTSFGVGYFFQDLVILTKLINLGFKNIQVNFIGDFKDFSECVTNPEINSLAVNNNLGTNLNDNNPKKDWAIMLSFRIIKFLEWFETLGCKMDLRLYNTVYQLIDECQTSKDNFSDITVGIDYVDEFIANVTVFNALALYTTSNNGLVFSLRTNGLPVVFDALYYSLEVYKVSNVNFECYKDFIDEKDKLFEELEKLQVKTSASDNDVFAPPNTKDEVKNYEFNGEEWLSIKYLDGYKEKEKEISKLNYKIINYLHNTKSKQLFIKKFENSTVRFVCSIVYDIWATVISMFSKKIFDAAKDTIVDLSTGVYSVVAGSAKTSYDCMKYVVSSIVNSIDKDLDNNNIINDEKIDDESDDKYQ